jgi:Papain family cysteine protease
MKFSAVHIQRPEPLSALHMQRVLQTYNEIQKYPFPPVAGTPPPSRLLTAQKYNQLYGLQDLVDLPEYFSWMKEPYISRAFDQQSCGDCWAFSMATVMSDRYAIAMKNAGQTPVNPFISPTAVTFCVSELDTSAGATLCGRPEALNSNYCNGSCDTLSSYEAWARSPGISRMECVAKKQCPDGGPIPACDFDWCIRRQINNFMCERLTKKDYNQIGSCATFCQGCQLIQITNPVAIQGFVSTSLSDGENKQQSDANNVLIKQKLVTNGPFTVNFIVPADFEAWFSGCTPMSPNDIYVFGPMARLTTGGHAVVLVGYGSGYLTYTITSIPGYTTYQRFTIVDTPQKPGQQKVSYWIVRNSWGSVKGYDGGAFNMLAPGYETQETKDMIPTRFANVVYAAEPILAGTPEPAVYYECGPDRGTCVKSATKTPYTNPVFCGCDTCIPNCRGRCEGSDGCGSVCSCSPLSKLDPQKIVLIVGGIVLVLVILGVLLG